MNERKRINIDVSHPDTKEGRMLDVIVNWSGMKTKPFIEHLIHRHVIEQIETKDHFKAIWEKLNQE